MSRRGGSAEPGKAGWTGPVGMPGISTYAVETGLALPWLYLVVGRDRRSWAVHIQVSGTPAPDGSRTAPEVLLDARWMRDPTDLAMVALWAQSGLRKVSIDRGWPLV